MVDGFVQLATDGPGKRVDASELTRADGVLVERQRAVIGDASDPLALLKVRPDGNVAIDFAELLIEARKQTALLMAINLHLASASGLSLTIDELLES